MRVACDFDGVITREVLWPEVGELDLEMVGALREARTAGAVLILWTCRRGMALDAAVAACRGAGLEFDAVNGNDEGLIAEYGGDSRKVFADLYLDDKALGWSRERAVMCLKAMAHVGMGDKQWFAECFCGAEG